MDKETKTILEKLELKGEKALGKIPYNLIKTYALLCCPAALGIYAGAKILPFVAKALVSKKMLNVYKKAGISTFSIFGKALKGTAKYTALGLGTAAYLSAKAINKGYKFIKNKFFRKNKTINSRTFQQYTDTDLNLNTELEPIVDDVVIEKNEEELETKATEATFGKENSDITKIIENAPEFNIISQAIDDKLHERYTEEELSAILKLNEKAYDDIVKKACEELKITNSEFADAVDKLTKLTDEFKAKDKETEEKTKDSELDIEVNESNNDSNSESNNNSSSSEDNNTQSTSKDMENESTLQNPDITQSQAESEVENEIEFEDEAEIGKDKQDVHIELNEIIEEAADLQSLEDLISAENIQRMNDLDEMQNGPRDLNINLSEDKNLETPGDVTFEESELVPIETHEFTSTITLDNIEKSMGNDEIVKTEVTYGIPEEKTENKEDVSKTAENKTEEIKDTPIQEEQFIDESTNYTPENGNPNPNNTESKSDSNAGSKPTETTKTIESIENTTIIPENKNKEKTVEEKVKPESKKTGKNQNAKEILDEIQLSEETTMIFKIDAEGKIYQTFNFGGKMSGERVISDEDYARFKKDSLHVAKNRTKKKVKTLENDGFAR